MRICVLNCHTEIIIIKIIFGMYMMIKTELFESRSKILSPDFSYIYKHLFVQTIDDWLAFIVIIIVIIHSFSHSLLLLLLFVLSEVICIVGRYLTITNLLAAIVCDAMLCSLHCTTLLLAPITKNYYHYVCRQRRGYFFFFFRSLFWLHSNWRNHLCSSFSKTTFLFNSCRP